MKRTLMILVTIWILGNLYLFNSSSLQIVGDPIVFDNCDSLTPQNVQWKLTKETNWNQTLTIDTQNQIEGSGCIKVQIDSAPAMYLSRLTDNLLNLETTPIIQFKIWVSGSLNQHLYLILRTLNITAGTGETFSYSDIDVPLNSWQTVTIDLRYPTSGSPDLSTNGYIGFHWSSGSGSLYNQTLRIDDIKVGAAEGTVDPLTVSLTPQTSSITLGSSATFVAQPSGGVSPYTYSWSLNGVVQSETSNSITLTPSSTGTYSLTVTVTDQMGTDAQAQASLTVNEQTSETTQYSLIIHSSTGGSTSPNAGTYKYDEGTNITLQAYPDNGYVFSYWIVNGNNVTDNPTSIIMNENCEVTPHFSKTSNILPPPEPPPTSPETPQTPVLHLGNFILWFNVGMLAIFGIVWLKGRRIMK